MIECNIPVLRKLLAFILVWFGGMLPGKAQIGRNSQEVWPSIDAYYRINPKFRLYATAGLTRLDSSTYSDGALGIFVDYFTFPLAKLFRPDHNDSLPGKFLWLRAGYQYSATPPSSKDPFKENMVVTEANSRFFLPLGMLMTVKNRFDWRFNNGSFKTRYRPKVNIEKDMNTEYLFFTAYGYLEYYFNLGDPEVNRLKSQIGIELRVTRFINYEILWNHQFANLPEIGENDAFGMTLKFYLDKHTFDFIKKSNKKKKKTEKVEEP